MKAYLYLEGGEKGKRMGALEDRVEAAGRVGCEGGSKGAPWTFGSVFLLLQEGASLTDSRGSPGR